MTDLTTCPSKDALVTCLYDEDDAGSREAIEAHLAACVACRDEVSALLGVRSRLAGWMVPDLDAHVTLVTHDAAERVARPWAWVFRPAYALPAAAMLVLGLAAGLANLEVRYGSGGLVVRTGWAARPSTLEGVPRDAAAVSLTPVASAAGGSDGAPWRQDLRVLERQLRQEFLSPGVRPAFAPASSGGAIAGGRTTDAALLRQIQALIDESEVRQQRNLALRVAELSRDFDLQRQADLVQIRQGMGRLEGRTEAEAARARELMNYIVRVSQGEGSPR
jgi:hypothetical protein